MKRTFLRRLSRLSKLNPLGPLSRFSRLGPLVRFSKLGQLGPLGAFGLLLLFSIASCRTLPEAPQPEILDWLPSSSSLVMRLEVPGNRALADLFLSSAGAADVGGDDSSELKAVLDRTVLLAVGIEYSDDFSLLGSSVIHLAALGRWPRAFIGASLPKSWRKVKPYRWEDDRGTGLAAVSRREILFSSGRLDEMIKRRERGRAVPALQMPVGEMPGGAVPAASKSDLMIRVTDARLIDSLAPVIAGRIEGIELSLMRAEETAYSASVNLYPADARLAGPLALAVRIALASRFGLSPHAEERNLLSGTAVDIDAASGAVRADFPPMSLDVIGRILRGMGA